MFASHPPAGRKRSNEPIINSAGPTFGEFQEGCALLNGSARNAEESFPVFDCESGMALGNVGSDRQCRTIQLVNEEIEIAWECLRGLADSVRKIHRLLVNEKLLECEGHLDGPEKSSRTGEQENAGEGDLRGYFSAHLITCSAALLL
jgi:hypothetical protein